MAYAEPRILIVRLTALGDVIHGLPAACALRDAFPRATLAWVVEGGAGDLVEGHPALDHVVRLPRRWWKSATAIFEARRRLRALEFDTTVDLQGLTKSAMIAWLSGAKRRLGPGGEAAREASGWLNNRLVKTDATHVIDHYLGILKPLGASNRAVRFDLPELSADATFAQRTLKSLNLAPQGFVVLNPGAGWESKLWPAERYGELAKRIHERFGLLSLAVWAGDGERRLAETIVATSDGKALLAPPTCLRELCAVVRQARLFVGSDTGPMHLAVAVDTPAVSMHGTSRAEQCGAYGAGNRRLQAYYQAGTATERRNAKNDAMRAITVEQTFAACAELLAESAARRCG